MASRNRVTLGGKASITHVLLPESEASRRYHKPVREGDLMPECKSFRQGYLVPLDAASADGRRGCRTCWPYEWPEGA